MFQHGFFTLQTPILSFRGLFFRYVRFCLYFCIIKSDGACEVLGVLPRKG